MEGLNRATPAQPTTSIPAPWIPLGWHEIAYHRTQRAVRLRNRRWQLCAAARAELPIRAE